MAKQAKKTQTSYTTGGHDISETAIPMYQENLKRMDDYLANPSARTDEYLEKYYSDNVANSDALRDYQRAMSDMTASNYNATGGGYQTLGQRNYDDEQRYWNDYMARLRDQGVQNAAAMANQDYQNYLLGNQSYGNAYGLGKDYSDIEQYNYITKQANNNWLSQGMGAAGGVLSAIPTPWTQAIGGALSAAGELTSVDTSNALRSMGIQNPSVNSATNSYQNLGLNVGNTLNDLFKKRKKGTDDTAMEGTIA